MSTSPRYVTASESVELIRIICERTGVVPEKTLSVVFDLESGGERAFVVRAYQGTGSDIVERRIFVCPDDYDQVVVR